MTHFPRRCQLLRGRHHTIQHSKWRTFFYGVLDILLFFVVLHQTRRNSDFLNCNSWAQERTRVPHFLLQFNDHKLDVIIKIKKLRIITYLFSVSICSNCPSLFFVFLALFTFRWLHLYICKYCYTLVFVLNKMYVLKKYNN